MTVEPQGKKKISTNVKDGNKLDIPLQRNQNDLDGADDDADLLQVLLISSDTFWTSLSASYVSCIMAAVALSVFM